MKRILMAAALIMTALLGAAIPSVPAAAWRDPICDMSGISAEDKENANCNAPGRVEDKVAGAITAVFSVVGVLAVGIIIFGGIRYMISQGDPGKIKKAKDTILYAVIGLVIALSAYGITMFIMGSIS